jgi:hypothetical protein
LPTYRVTPNAGGYNLRTSYKIMGSCHKEIYAINK